MALTDIHVKHLQARNKKFSVSDGRGLLLEVRSNGQKYWIVRVWDNGKEKRKHIGSYPEMSLKEAQSVGAEGSFANKYGERVKVYTIGDVSKEIAKSSAFCERDVRGNQVVMLLKKSQKVFTK